jgi:hypothetical protein
MIETLICKLKGHIWQPIAFIGWFYCAVCRIELRQGDQQHPEFLYECSRCHKQTKDYDSLIYREGRPK